MGGRADADLVHAVFRVHHQHVFTAQIGQHPRQRLHQFAGEHAQHLVGRPGGIGQRAQHVEDGAHAHLLARADGVLHGAVVPGREHEAHPHPLDALRHLFGREVQVHPGGLQHVGAAGLAGDGTVAVLGHLAASGGDHETAGGGDIEGAGAVAAGADDVDHVLAVHLHPGCQLAHHLGSGGDLVDGLALHAQADEKTADLRRRGGAGHDGVHHRAHLLA